jgi:hypothetical protein
MTGHVDWIGALVILGVALHTLCCMLIIIAIKYCPRWFLVGWIALCLATVGVFFRRVGFAYAMIAYGTSRPFFPWEYAAYVGISFCWGITGLQMILHGREHGDTTFTSQVTTSTKIRSSERRDLQDIQGE